MDGIGRGRNRGTADQTIDRLEQQGGVAPRRNRASVGNRQEIAQCS